MCFFENENDVSAKSGKGGHMAISPARRVKFHKGLDGGGDADGEYSLRHSSTLTLIIWGALGAHDSKSSKD